jgi:hypothetical protein
MDVAVSSRTPALYDISVGVDAEGRPRRRNLLVRLSILPRQLLYILGQVARGQRSSAFSDNYAESRTQRMRQDGRPAEDTSQRARKDTRRHNMLVRPPSPTATGAGQPNAATQATPPDGQKPPRSKPIAITKPAQSPAEQARAQDRAEQSALYAWRQYCMDVRFCGKYGYLPAPQAPQSRAEIPTAPPRHPPDSAPFHLDF